MKLTGKQREALRYMLAIEHVKAEMPARVWDFGSTTVHVLRERGLIRTHDGACWLTDAGREEAQRS